MFRGTNCHYHQHANTNQFCILLLFEVAIKFNILIIKKIVHKTAQKVQQT